MSRLIHLFAQMYPRAWRARYGVEYAALLEDLQKDVRPDARTAADVLSGALLMQIRTWNSWKIVAVSAALGVAVIGGLFAEFPKTYVSSAIIKVDGQGTPQETIDRINTIRQSIESRGKLTEIITTHNLYLPLRTRMPLEDVIEEMRRNITIEQLGGPNVPAFRVKFSYNEPQLTQRVTQDLVARFLDGNFRQAAASQSADSAAGTTLQVLDAASLPMTPAYPNKSLIFGSGIVCFLLAWGGLSAWRTVSSRHYGAAGGSVSSDFAVGPSPAIISPPVREHLRRKAWKIVAVVVLLVAVAVFAYKLANPNYESKAVIRVNATVGAEEAGRYLGLVAGSVESRSSLTRIIGDQNLYVRDRQRMSLEGVIDKMRKNIHIEPLGNGLAAQIRFTYPDNHSAQRVTDALASRFVQEGVARGPISILDPASLPEGRLPPVESLSFSVGLFLGALFGVLLALIIRLFRRSPVPA